MNRADPVPGSTAAPSWLDVQELYDHAPSAYVTMTPDGVIQHVNATFVAWTGHQPQDVVGVRRLADLLPPGVRAIYLTHHLPALEAAGAIREDSAQVVCADGTRLPVSLSSTMRYRDDGAPWLIHTALADATVSARYEREVRAARDRERDARERTEALLADRERLMRKEAAVGAVAHLALTGADPERLLDETVAAVRRALVTDDVQLLAPGDPRLDDPVPPDGARVPIGGPGDLCGVLVVTPTDRVLLPESHAFLDTLASVVWLAIERRRLHDRDRHLALHDALTGLPNRLLLQDRLVHALARARRDGTRIAVLLLDLDGFKAINDTLGHQAGDLALRTVAERLATAARASDTVARLGGDEFVVVCDDLPDATHAHRAAERLQVAVAEPMLLEGRPWRLGVSVGLALAAGDVDATRLLQEADRAMYAVKERRRIDARA